MSASLVFESLEPRQLLTFALTPVFTGPVTNLLPVGGQVFIESADYSNGLTSIFLNDGSTSGNHLLTSIPSYSDNNATSIDFNGQALFTLGSHYFNSNPSLWLSNGTVEGTRPAGAQRFYYQDFRPTQTAKLGSFYYGLVSDVENQGVQRFVRFRDGLTPVNLATFTDPYPTSGFGLGSVINAGNRLYFFSGDINEVVPTTGVTLWTSDGTKAGTHTVKAFDRYQNLGATVADWASSRHPQNNAGTSDFYFMAADATTGLELWKTDGTASGTVRLTDINPGTGDSAILGLGSVGGKFVFYANTQTQVGLYASDGTAAGTAKIADTYYLNPPTTDEPDAADAFVWNGKIYFEAGGGNQTWVSDGTAAGTKKLADVALPRGFTDFRGQLYFSGIGLDGFSHVYRTDGSTAGTAVAVGIPNNTTGNLQVDHNLSVIGNSLFFSVRDIAHNDAQILYRLSDTRTSISGVAFDDTNANGVRDRGELPRAGAIIYLDANNNSAADLDELHATTDSLGRYSFADVAPGTYVPRELNDLLNWQTTVSFDQVQLAAGDRVVANFGSTHGAVVTGHIYNDSDASGHFNITHEPGVPGLSVFLDLNDNGKRDVGEAIATTDDVGRYVFRDLEAKTYTVRLLASPIWLNTTSRRKTAVAAEEAPLGADFGVGIPPTIVGRVTDYDTGKTIKSGVNIFLDGNGNGVVDAGEPVTTSDTLGRYRFSGSTIPASKTTIALVPGQGLHVDQRSPQRELELRLGEFYPYGYLNVSRVPQLTGKVFLDNNHNNKFDPIIDKTLNQSYLVVYLDTNKNGKREKTEPVATWDQYAGIDTYIFSDLTPGAQQIIRIAAIQQVISPASGQYVVAPVAGQLIEHLDFATQQPA